MMQLTTSPFTPFAVTKQDIQWQDYTGFAEILTERLALRMPIFPLSLGGQGLFNAASVLGATPRDVAVSMNGCSLVEPSFGAFNLEQFPPEMMERAEVFIGSDAALMADNAAGALINVQEALHNAKRPFSRIWWGIAGANFGAVDVTLSYNVAPDLNATVGVRSMISSDWQPNSALRLWNVRSALRWNAAPNANFTLTYLYTQHRTGMNAGVDTPRVALAGSFSSPPYLSEFEQNVERHDLTLLGTLRLDGRPDAPLREVSDKNLEKNLEKSSGEKDVRRSAPDTAPISGVLSVTAYGSLANWTHNRRSTLQGRLPYPPDTLQISTFATVSLGATARIETALRLGVFTASLLAGGTLGVEAAAPSGYFVGTSADALNPSAGGLPNGVPIGTLGAPRGVVNAFGRLQFSLADDLSLSGGARLSVVNERPQIALGGRITASLGRVPADKKENTEKNTERSIELFGDISRSFRSPALAEAATRAELNGLRSEGHLLICGGANIVHASPTLQLTASAMGFYRLITAPIVAEPVFTLLPGQVVKSPNPPQPDTTLYLLTARSFNEAERAVIGASASVDMRLSQILFAQGNLLLSGFAQSYLSTTNGSPDQRLPALYASLTAQYEYVIGRSVLRLGVRARLLTAFRGERFLPSTWSYAAQNADAATPREAIAGFDQGLSGNGIDIIAGAEVGNAYIRATYQNALNQQYFYVPVYPMYSTNLRLSVSWTFLD
jgi:hypothetical protein